MSLLTRLFFLIIILSTVACAKPTLMLEANSGNLKQARTVAATFYEVYGQQVGLKDIPFVTLDFGGDPGHSYDVSHNVLFITPFKKADFQTCKLFAKASPKDRAINNYDSYSFAYETAHQMMHLLYEDLNLAPVSIYERETRISTMAILFLREYGLIADNEAELFETLKRMKLQLSDLYPDVVNGDMAIQELEVNDTNSYWFVTANSLLTAMDFAKNTDNSRQFISTISQGYSAK